MRTSHKQIRLSSASGLLIRESQFDITWEALVIVPLLIAGVIGSLQWIALLPQFDVLVRVRVGELARIEARPEMKGIISPVFRREALELKQIRKQLWPLDVRPQKM